MMTISRFAPVVTRAVGRCSAVSRIKLGAMRTCWSGSNIPDPLVIDFVRTSVHSFHSSACWKLGTRWTEEEIRKVMEARREGVPFPEIAKMLSSRQITASAISDKIQRLGLRTQDTCLDVKWPTPLLPKRRPWTKTEEETLRVRFAAGESDQNIASELNRSKDSVGSKRQDCGLLRSNRGPHTFKFKRGKRHKWTLEQQGELEKYYRQGLTDKAIADKFSFQPTPTMIFERRNVLGLRRFRLSTAGVARSEKDFSSVQAEP